MLHAARTLDQGFAAHCKGRTSETESQRAVGANTRRRKWSATKSSTSCGSSVGMWRKFLVYNNFALHTWSPDGTSLWLTVMYVRVCVFVFVMVWKRWLSPCLLRTRLQWSLRCPLTHSAHHASDGVPAFSSAVQHAHLNVAHVCTPVRNKIQMSVSMCVRIFRIIRHRSTGCRRHSTMPHSAVPTHTTAASLSDNNATAKTTTKTTAMTTNSSSSFTNVVTRAALVTQAGQSGK